MKKKGVVASGHPVTAEAAAEILRAGGNAFDASVAAFFAACVAEPVLASPGGGGFLLARPGGSDPIVFDFFAQTPVSRQLEGELDFVPVLVDFGSAQQEFHIGMGAIATPGCIRGMFEIHKALCTMPMTELVKPAVDAAREGIQLNELQAYIFSLVEPIYLYTKEARGLFGSVDESTGVAGQGECLTFVDLAEILELIALEGDDLFYRGEVGQAIVEACRQGGGYLSYQDLTEYRVHLRRPMTAHYGQRKLWTNPAPSAGGMLIVFALQLLESLSLSELAFGSGAHLEALAQVLRYSNQARGQYTSDSELPCPDQTRLLAEDTLRHYQALLADHALVNRGTTHLSIIDAQENVATMTVSNGEGCGHIVPGTGIMLNNMLGEQDLSPAGFHKWRPDMRMSSMMAPTIVQTSDGVSVATGSGGSNRIRTALVQVISNLVDFSMGLEEAVHAPRIHVEVEKLCIEGGFENSVVDELVDRYPDTRVFGELNLFFGGAHSVQSDTKGFSGSGDPRRGGVSLIV